MFSRLFGRRDAISAPAPSETRVARTIVVPIDDSQESKYALKWACENIVGPQDKLYLLTVEHSVAGPYTAEIPETDVPAPASGAVKKWHVEQEKEAAASRHVLEVYKEHAASLGVNEEAITTTTLAPASGASGVGQSILRFSEDTKAHMVVLGSRGMGGLRRSFMSLMGLGSVSDFMLQHASCPVVVVKNDCVQQEDGRI